MLSWEGLGRCLGAAALYIVGDAEVLKSVTRVNQLHGLGAIKCELSGLLGVIVKETAHQQFLKLDEAGKWIRDSKLVHSTRKSVPWFLDDGTGRAFVVGARSASHFNLPVSSEALEGPGRSIMCGTVDSLYHKGLKAVKDDNGTITIQRPHEGPFYVSSKTVDQLISNRGIWARFYKYTAMAWIITRFYKYVALGLSIFGLFFVSKHANLHLMEIWSRRRLKLQKRDLAAAAKRSSQDNKNTLLSRENDKTNNGSDGTKRDGSTPDHCSVQRDYNAVLVPCGHTCCCVECCSQLKTCPLCCRRIKQVVKNFRRSALRTHFHEPS